MNIFSPYFVEKPIKIYGYLPKRLTNQLALIVLILVLIVSHSSRFKLEAHIVIILKTSKVTRIYLISKEMSLLFHYCKAFIEIFNLKSINRKVF